MLTYQDLLEVQDTDEARMDFVRKCINQHKSSDLYKTALIANEYNAHRNVTIVSLPTRGRGLKFNSHILNRVLFR